MKHGATLYTALNNPAVDKTAFLSSIDNSFALLALRAILKQELQQALATPLADYDKASWSAYQAHKNGEVAILNKLTDLLS